MLNLEDRSSEKVIKSFLDNLPYESGVKVRSSDGSPTIAHFFGFNPQLNSYVFFARKKGFEDVDMYIIDDRGLGFNRPEVLKAGQEEIPWICARYEKTLDKKENGGKEETECILKRLIELDFGVSIQNDPLSVQLK